jgi:hypothetical protein
VQIRILPEKLTLLWNGNNTQKTMPNNQTKRGSKPAGRALLDDDPSRKRPVSAVALAKRSRPR